MGCRASRHRVAPPRARRAQNNPAADRLHTESENESGSAICLSAEEELLFEIPLLGNEDEVRARVGVDLPARGNCLDASSIFVITRPSVNNICPHIQAHHFSLFAHLFLGTSAAADYNKDALYLSRPPGRGIVQPVLRLPRDNEQYSTKAICRVA